MNVETIVQDRIALRNPCQHVSSIEEGRLLADRLERFLRSCDHAAAVAANQLGLPYRIFSMRMKSGVVASFINPTIIDKVDLGIFFGEGCLSIPGKKVDTVRYKTIEFVDDQGRNERFTGFQSVVVQHEVSHLQGILMNECGVPAPYEKCFCGSDKKFKFCCLKFGNIIS